MNCAGPRNRGLRIVTSAVGQSHHNADVESLEVLTGIQARGIQARGIQERANDRATSSQTTAVARAEVKVSKPAVKVTMDLKSLRE